MEQLTLDDLQKATVKELKEYLEGFDENENISLIVIDSRERVHYDGEMLFISDTPIPTILYNITKKDRY